MVDDGCGVRCVQGACEFKIASGCEIWGSDGVVLLEVLRNVAPRGFVQIQSDTKNVYTL
jgi:hypothetical protein